jgi:hypothetical protein
MDLSARPHQVIRLVKGRERGKRRQFLLIAELDGDRQMHRHGFAIDSSGLIFPLA